MKTNLNAYIKGIEDTIIFSQTDKFGLITRANANFCKISGYEEKELIGKKHNILKHPDMKRSSFDKLWKNIEEKKPYRILFKNIDKKGNTFYLDSMVIPIFDESGDICAYSSFSYDLTKFFTLNEELMSARKKSNEISKNFRQIITYHQQNLARQKDNVEAHLKSNFKLNEKKAKQIHKESLNLSVKQTLANLAHQWRQPLNELNILLFQLKNDKNAFNKHYARSKELIKQMSTSIDSFANLFEKQKFANSFSLNEALQEVQDINFEILENAGVSLRIESKRDYRILGIKDDLIRVFFHLIMNSIEAYGKEKNKEIFITMSKFSKNYVKISVKDKAGGILFLDKVFEPFFTTKYPVQGAGLDLYFSKQIIESMGGQIKVSNSKKGACFNIYLRQDEDGR